RVMPAARSAIAPTSMVGACNDKAAPVEEELLLGAGEVEEPVAVLLVAAEKPVEYWIASKKWDNDVTYDGKAVDDSLDVGLRCAQAGKVVVRAAFLRDTVGASVETRSRTSWGSALAAVVPQSRGRGVCGEEEGHEESSAHDDSLIDKTVDNATYYLLFSSSPQDLFSFAGPLVLPSAFRDPQSTEDALDIRVRLSNYQSPSAHEFPPPVPDVGRRSLRHHIYYLELGHGISAFSSQSFRLGNKSGWLGYGRSNSEIRPI
ncbi:16158_t:CDS:2, partial [Acaulospora colombiana]